MMALKMLLVRVDLAGISFVLAKEVVAVTKARVAGIPVFFSDGFTCYLAALIAAFHVVTTFARNGKRGRLRTPQ